MRPGKFVICAVSGRHIPLDALRYWDPRTQEAYAGPEEGDGAVEKPAHVNRRNLIALGLAAAATGARAQDTSGLNLKGRFIQSGYGIGQTAPGATITVDGVARGRPPPPAGSMSALIATRRPPPPSRPAARPPPWPSRRQTYDVQRVDGLPQETVTPTDPAVLKRIEHDIALKNAAFASRANIDAFKGGFVYPLDKFVCPATSATSASSTARRKARTWVSTWPRPPAHRSTRRRPAWSSWPNPTCSSKAASFWSITARA
ncbi:MAG: DUF2093 domain-containing protein [Asticcacaulis sp.]